MYDCKLYSFTHQGDSAKGKYALKIRIFSCESVVLLGEGAGPCFDHQTSEIITDTNGWKWLHIDNPTETSLRSRLLQCF